LLGGLTILKALPLLLLAVVVIALTFPPPNPGPPPALTALETGILVTFYAFIGFENVTVPAGETRRPERAVPRAIFATLAAMTLLYFLVQLAFVSALPAGADEGAPLIDLGAWLAGLAGVLAITLAAIASLAGNLHSNLASTPRLTYAMATRRDLPAWFGRVHARFETPANSIAFMAVLAAALALSGSFVVLAAVSVLSRLFVYAVTIAALPRAPGRPRLGALSWVSGAAGIIVCAWAATQADLNSWLTLAALAAGGLLLYAIAALFRVRSS
jgi:amino acid transporter